MGGMRMSFDYSGLIAQLEEAGGKGLAAAKVGLYEAAGTVADAIRAEAASLPYDGDTVSQIQGAIGIANFRDGAAESDTSISVDGYFRESGFPIPFFVNEIEHGTSWLKPHPFMRTAARRVMAEAEAKGNKAAEAYAQKILDNIKDE